ncbi:hypothetical protein EV182_001904 [Spiromyces aspiralis]|uniref:Uncharacterized protein n=1 Tax=Spiromyces aspiralis TaxID=68401 RepID=A0ACC1HEV9_9FUNG|nr:hypothetical protein EV182_001904 [Spiromyces aspiralis]
MMLGSLTTVSAQNIAGFGLKCAATQVQIQTKRYMHPSCLARFTDSCLQQQQASSTQAKVKRIIDYPYDLHKITPSPVQPPFQAGREGVGLSALTFMPVGKAKSAPAAAIVGWVKEVQGQPSDEITPRNFIENPEFMERVQAVVGKYATDDNELQAYARYQKTGWLNISDNRNPPPAGRTAYPEDIFGTIKLEDGQMVSGTYQRMPTHRPVTNDGLFQLPRGLHQWLLKTLFEMGGA